MSSAKLILITALLVNYSSASDIINQFADPSLILNSQTDYVQEEEVVGVESSQIDYTQEEEVVSSQMDYTQEEEVISTIDDSSNISDSQDSYSNPPEIIVENEPSYITTIDSESINNEPSSITTVESNPTNAIPYSESTSYESHDNEPHFQKAENGEYIKKKQKGLNLTDLDNQNYNPIAPDIQGKYRLIRGTDLHINKTIQEGYLVVEKLDDKNFGYYYSFTVEKASPEMKFGIFNYYRGKFYQRAIKNEGSLETENLKNTNIIAKEDKIRLEINIGDETQNTLWEHDNEGVVPFAIQKPLKEAKHDYEEIYKKNFSKLTY